MSKFILITLNIIKFHTLPRLIFHIAVENFRWLTPWLFRMYYTSYILLLCYADIKFNKRERGIYSIYSSKNARYEYEWNLMRGIFAYARVYVCQL